MSGYACYGAPVYSENTPGLPKARFSHAHRRRNNVVVIILSTLVPPAIFAAVNAALSFSIHFDHPTACWLVVALCLVATIAAGVLAIQARRESWRATSQLAAAWLVFLAVFSVVAFVAAVVLGRHHYWVSTLPLREAESLSAYHDVDPSSRTGSQMTDAGLVSFVKTSHLDLGKAMMFKNDDMYCVAPIVSDKTTKTYDFWAVGVDCCATEFQCAHYDDPNAHSGVRLLREDQEGYFKLAVQQAQAAYGIRSGQPLFFYWAHDTVSELKAFEDEAKHSVTFECSMFLAFQVTAVIIAVVLFGVWGRTWPE